MKELFRGKYVGALLWKGVSGQWYVDVSYFGLKTFETREEAMDYMEDVGVFQK